MERAARALMLIGYMSAGGPVKNQLAMMTLAASVG